MIHRKSLFTFILLFLSSITYAQYGNLYLNQEVYIINPTSDSSFTFTNAWYIVDCYTLDDSVDIEFGDASTSMDSVTTRMIQNVVFTIPQWTPLKKCYIHNLSIDTIKVYFKGSKTLSE